MLAGFPECQWSGLGPDQWESNVPSLRRCVQPLNTQGGLRLPMCRRQKGIKERDLPQWQVTMTLNPRRDRGSQGGWPDQAEVRRAFTVGFWGQEWFPGCQGRPTAPNPALCSTQRISPGAIVGLLSPLPHPKISFPAFLG